MLCCKPTKKRVTFCLPQNTHIRTTLLQHSKSIPHHPTHTQACIVNVRLEEQYCRERILSFIVYKGLANEHECC